MVCNVTYMLALQSCTAGVHTLHGLWPDGAQWCPGPAFDPNAVRDLEPALAQWWPSCEGDRNATAFHAHEWERHGTCSPYTQHAYFATALALRARYGPLPADRVCLDCALAKVPCRPLQPDTT